MRRSQVTVSAPGKVHLMGEHAVVYGRPALLAAISKRCRVNIAQKSKIKNQKSKMDNGIEVRDGGSGRLVMEAVRQVRRFYDLKRLGRMSISVDSDIPVGRGLGSSAAVAVATVGAVMAYLGKEWDERVINNLAYEVEKLQHGNPSGGDIAVGVYGGLVWFRKEFEWLRVVESVPFRVSPRLKRLYLIDTGKAEETTGEMVGYVSSNFKVQSAKFKKIFDRSEEQVKRMTEALKDGDESELMEAVRRGEKVLEEMGVVGREGQRMVDEIERLGGVAKVTGGGGRKGAVGMLVGYHRQPDKLLGWGKRQGINIVEVRVEREGVRIEAE